MNYKVVSAAAVAVAVLIAISIYFIYEKELENDTIVLYGNVDVRQVDLGFRVNGRVVDMLFDEGDFIEPGTLMGFLDPEPYQEELAQAAAKVAATKASLENAEWMLKRRTEVVDTGAVSKENYSEAFYSVEQLRGQLKEAIANQERAETRLRDTQVFSPHSGVILTRVREPGAVVNFGEPIYTLSITSPVWVRAFLTEPQLGAVFQGMEAEVFTDSPELPVYKGHIGFISPVAEFTPKTVETSTLRTDLVYRIRVIVDNPDKFLKQGMPVTVRIHAKQEQSS